MAFDNASKPVKVPKTLGACADRLLELAELKKKHQRKLEKTAPAVALAAIEEEDKAIREYLINNLPKSDANGVVGRKAKAVVTSSPVPHVDDWDRFYKHVLKTKDFSLMHRAVSTPAIRERWENKETVPGVSVFNNVKVSVTKL